MSPAEPNDLTPDDIRRQAEARRLTLEPVNADVKPDEEPDSVQIARKLNAPPPANAPNDTEQDIPAIQPAKGLQSDMQSKPLPTSHINSAVLAAVVFVVGIILIIVLYVLI
jgi:hypothetical protein